MAVIVIWLTCWLLAWYIFLSTSPMSDCWSKPILLSQSFANKFRGKWNQKTSENQKQLASDTLRERSLTLLQSKVLDFTAASTHLVPGGDAFKAFITETNFTMNPSSFFLSITHIKNYHANSCHQRLEEIRLISWSCYELRIIICKRLSRKEYPLLSYEQSVVHRQMPSHRSVEYASQKSNGCKPEHNKSWTRNHSVQSSSQSC